MTHSGEREVAAWGGGRGSPAKPKLGQGSGGLVVRGHSTGVQAGPGR